METNRRNFSNQEVPRRLPINDLDADPQKTKEEEAEVVNTLEIFRSPLTVSAIPHLPDNDLHTWTELSYKYLEMGNIDIYFNKELDEQYGEEKDGPYAVGLKRTISVAKKLILFNALERQNRLADKNGFGANLKQFSQLNNFYMNAEVYIKIGGLPIKDVVSDPPPSPAEFYRSLMAAPSLSSKLNYEELLDENKDNVPMNTYPNMTKVRVSEAIRDRMLMVLLAQEINNLLQGLGTSGKGANELINVAKRITERYLSMSKKTLSTILDPNSQDFIALKDLVDDSLNQKDKRTKEFSLMYLGLHHRENIIREYRESRKQSLEPSENSPFYSRLAQAIKEYAKESLTVLLTQEDLPIFVNENITIEDDSVPSFEDLRKITNSIFQRTSQTEYEIATDKINWQNLTPATSVRVDFPNGNSRIFIVHFHYENEQDEETNVDLEYDTRKDSFDWKPFLEDTNDPEMKQLKNGSLLVTQSILSQIQIQAQADYQQRQAAQMAKRQIQRPAQGRKIRSDEPYIPRQKEKRQERPRPLTPIQEILLSEMPLSSQPKQSEIKNQIVYQEMEELGEKMKYLTPEDTIIVTNGIEQFNQRGVGEFNRLTQSGKVKTPLFTLRVNTGKGGGGIRVLLSERRSENDSPNTHSFEILTIGYRKDIYTKRGL